MDKYYQVAVDYPKNPSILTYKSKDSLELGRLVEVPLGRRKSHGVVWEETTEEKLSFDKNKIKEVKPLDSELTLSKEERDLYQWMSKYYHYPLGQVIYDSLPPILKRPQKKIFIKGDSAPFDFTLNQNQLKIFEEIQKKLKSGFNQHLIHGVTGSGKSLIFLKLILETLNSGKSVQFLVPEINLTPQMINYFKKYVTGNILSYHSGVTKSEKNLIWKELKTNKEPQLILGVRSSIFLPIQNLGLIIVDEEHDSSFKQTDRCPYNGRDIAIKKAQIHQCPVVLGSATPTLENFYHFKKEANDKHYHVLNERALGAKFPQIILSNARDQGLNENPSWPFIPETIEKITEHLKRGDQVLIYVNKLGFASYIQCPHCANRFTNEKCGCDNNLRYFKQKNLLSCSHCDYKQKLPDSCPKCGSLQLMQMGFGTEKIQGVLQEFFPDKKIDRFDRDEITSFKELKEKLDEFNTQKIDILVGTQMLSKGHNFSKVNLVVILGIDSQMNMPDFRSSERVFQSVVQVAGRAGRFSEHSEVIIQSLNPEHSIFNYIKEQKFTDFYEHELPLRDLCHCPPFAKVAVIYFSHKNKDSVISDINRAYHLMLQNPIESKSYFFMSPPSPCSIEKRQNQYSWSIMLKAQNVNDLHQKLQFFELNFESSGGVSVKIDVDPMQIN
jgi:primosomal protein N' (replication factor Y)